MPQLTTGQWLPTVVFVRTNVTGENNFAVPVLSISETSPELLVVHNALCEVTELVLPAFFPSVLVQLLEFRSNLAWVF